MINMMGVNYDKFGNVENNLQKEYPNMISDWNIEEFMILKYP